MSQNEKFFLFYFGTVTLRPLVNCDSNVNQHSNGNILCALKSPNTEFKSMGIRSEKIISTNETLKGGSLFYCA